MLVDIIGKYTKQQRMQALAVYMTNHDPKTIPGLDQNIVALVDEICKYEKNTLYRAFKVTVADRINFYLNVVQLME